MVALRSCLLILAFSYRQVVSYNIPGNYGSPPVPIGGSYSAAAVIANGAGASINNYETYIQKVVNNITKPASESERSYRGLVLKNGMKVVLISDPNSNHSAAHIQVSSVGGMKDPRESFGMAHFVEHMLFQGSQKYPGKDEFDNYIRSNGGSENAYTSDDYTGYHFTIPHNNFKLALDMWAYFFISPLFDQNSIKREVNAVQSEYAKLLTSDAERFLHVYKNLCDNETHPYCNFVCGNFEALWTSAEKRNASLRAAAKKFFDDYYSATLMSLVVFSPENLDEMAKMVVPLFSQVPNKKLERTVWTQPFGKKHFLGKVVKIVPLVEKMKFVLKFLLPDLTNLETKRTFEYIQKLFNYAGHGSFQDKLLADGLISEFYQYYSRPAKGFGSYTFSFVLTKKGFSNTDEILTRLFSFIEAVKRKYNNEKWIHEDMKKLYKTKFEIAPKMADNVAISVVLNELCNEVPMEDVLSHHYAVEPEFDQKAVDYVLSFLNVENFNVMLQSKNFTGQTDKLEEYLQVPYSISDISPDLIAKLRKQDGSHDDTRIPKPNRFLSEKSSALQTANRNSSSDPKTPRIIFEDNLRRVWYANDVVFGEPLVGIKIRLRSPGVPNSPKDQAIYSILVGSLNDLIGKELQDASEADYQMSIVQGSNNDGLSISLIGRMDKMSYLVEEFFTVLATKEIESAIFQSNKESMEQRLNDQRISAPISMIWDYYSALVNQYWVVNEELLASLKNVTIQDVEQVRKELYNHCHFESFIFGVLSEHEALALSNKSVSILQTVYKMDPIFGVELTKNRKVMFPKGADFVYETTVTIQNETGVIVGFQIDTSTVQEQALLDLMGQAFGGHTFSKLRTEEQLGYATFSAPATQPIASMFLFGIGGPYHPHYVESRIEAFIKNMTQVTLPQINSTQFSDMKKTLAQNYLRKPTSMRQQFLKHWKKIMDGSYFFGKERAFAGEIGNITQKDLIQFAEKHLSAESPIRRKFSIHLFMKNADLMKFKSSNDWEIWKNLNRTKISHINEFKRSMPLYGLPKPHMELKPIGV